jgi:hypothetical protein
MARGGAPAKCRARLPSSGSRLFLAARRAAEPAEGSRRIRLAGRAAGQMRRQLITEDGKGEKDRVTMLPTSLKADLLEHLKNVKRLHEEDLRAGNGRVHLPHALARKYPRAAAEWGWQYVFPAPTLSSDPRSGERRRHHLHERGSSGPSNSRRGRRRSPSRPPATLFVILSRPIC